MASYSASWTDRVVHFLFFMTAMLIVGVYVADILATDKPPAPIQEATQSLGASKCLTDDELAVASWMVEHSPDHAEAYFGALRLNEARWDADHHQCDLAALDVVVP